MHEPAVKDRFELFERAGRGASAVVYRAWDRLLRRVVALKVFSEAGPDSEHVRREVEVLSGLRHPGVVAYLDHGVTDEERPFVITEWLEGETLHERLRGGQLTLRQVVQLVRGLASALGHAHVRGIVHRDVKPSNVFLLHKDPRVPKLLDFGIARPSYLSVLTRAGSIVGTPGYMAPEQARGEDDVDARADVFALGAVLYECMTGRPPFGAGSAVVVLARLLLDEIPRASASSPQIPAALDDLCAAMLARDPAERPADARAVLRILDGLGDLSDRAIPAAPRTSGKLERERRLFCVVVVGQPDPKDLPTDLTRSGRDTRVDTATMSRTVSSIPRSAITELLERYGFQAVLGGRATVLGVLPLGAGSDRLVQAARCALELRELEPTAPVALAAGHGTVGEGQADGEPLDRALALLRLAAEDPRGVLVDEATTVLLRERFEVEPHGEAWLLGAERRS